MPFSLFIELLDECFLEKQRVVSRNEDIKNLHLHQIQVDHFQFHLDTFVIRINFREILYTFLDIV
jgi:hypothetical protein